MPAGAGRDRRAIAPDPALLVVADLEDFLFEALRSVMSHTRRVEMRRWPTFATLTADPSEIPIRPSPPRTSRPIPMIRRSPVV